MNFPARAGTLRRLHLEIVMIRTVTCSAILLFALLLGALTGCGERRQSEPTPPVIEMGTGLFIAGWFGAAPCDSDSCVTQITTSYSVTPRFPDPPMLWVRVDTLELIEISRAEAESAFYLTEAALRVAPRSHGGCGGDLPQERLDVFSGDYGHGAEVQGCDAREVRAARAMFFALLDKYWRRGHTIRVGARSGTRGVD